MTRGQRVLSLLRSAARATAQQGATISEASSVNAGLRAFSSSSRAAAFAGVAHQRILQICKQ
jgi:hypothetical protein